MFNDKLVLSPSIRYDNYRSKEKSQGNYSEHHWSPSLALLWKATDWLDLSARYNEAFRAPSLQEKFTSGNHFGYSSRGRATSNKFVSNPNLKPEVAKNKEISAYFHFNNFITQNDKAELTTTFFQNDVKNLINLETYYSNPNSTFNFMPDLSQYRNIANARLRGFEIEGKYSFNNLSFALSYGQTRGKNKNSGEYLENINADKYSAAIDYALFANALKLGARISYYAKQDRVPKGYTSYPSYTLTDLTASFSPLSGSLKNIRIDLAIDNLFDKRYLPAFNLMEGTGRNVKVGVSYYF